MNFSSWQLSGLALWLVAGAVGAIVLIVLGAAWGAMRRGGVARRQRAELRRARARTEAQQQELMRLANQIVATSSTDTIVGYRVVRQIEAVFADGQPTAARAVEQVKAQAALRGGNALVNLASERAPGGGCGARGDAVVVEPTARAPDSQALALRD